ncbi:uncharacterized protein LOC125508858 isoform X2 [Triticum urartu]|uniref:uncharacterized protein LOC125508858 isoform X2 n=1 Tax=Triticum urartu TaxID=4572 RepID=UPI002043F9F1|nr:uncharacterized protein LOC125508858 isoform X2 [Triticum urartu]
MNLRGRRLFHRLRFLLVTSSFCPSVHRKMKRIVPFCWNCFSGLSNHSDQQAIVNERFDCRYTEIKVFYLIGWITTFQWSSHGPVIETLVKNLSLQFSQMGVEIEVSTFVDFLINYKNIDKDGKLPVTCSLQNLC